MPDPDAVSALIYLASCAVNGAVPEPTRVRAMDLPSVYREAERRCSPQRPPPRRQLRRASSSFAKGGNSKLPTCRSLQSFRQEEDYPFRLQ